MMVGWLDWILGRGRDFKHLRLYYYALIWIEPLFNLGSGLAFLFAPTTYITAYDANSPLVNNDLALFISQTAGGLLVPFAFIQHFALKSFDESSLRPVLCSIFLGDLISLTIQITFFARFGGPVLSIAGNFVIAAITISIRVYYILFVPVILMPVAKLSQTEALQQE